MRLTLKNTLSKAEIAEAFGVTLRTVNNWMNYGFPQDRVRGRLRFHFESCREWHQEHVERCKRTTRGRYRRHRPSPLAGWALR